MPMNRHCLFSLFRLPDRKTGKAVSGVLKQAGETTS